MLFVLLAHMFLIAASFSLILAVGAMVVVGFGLVAHYGNVVEEVGIEERDELPRFLRHFNLTDDVWLPFVRIFFAWIICFGMGQIIWIFGAAKNWPLPITFLSSLSFDCFGLIFFPAIVLITLTSGSLSNLHPMRILGTIGKIGPALRLLRHPLPHRVLHLSHRHLRHQHASRSLVFRQRRHHPLDPPFPPRLRLLFRHHPHALFRLAPGHGIPHSAIAIFPGFSSISIVSSPASTPRATPAAPRTPPRSRQTALRNKPDPRLLPQLIITIKIVIACQI